MEVRAHLPACLSCRELHLTVRLLSSESRIAEQDALEGLPLPQAILAVAQARPAGARRPRFVLWPIVWAERLGLFVMIGVAALLVLVFGESMVRESLGTTLDVVRNQNGLLSSALPSVAGLDPNARVLFAGAIVILGTTLHVFKGPGSSFR